MLSRRITPRRKGRRLLTVVAFSGLVVGTVLAAGAALAVPTPNPFELDANATSTSYDDWDKVCRQVTGADCSTSSTTSGALAVSFSSEGTGESIFTGGGSKDPQPIGNWLWKDGSVPDKDNLLHAFAARYASGGKQLLYFGSDRYANDGDAMQGFWFFQSAVSRTSTPGGGGFKFDGVHQAGDLLVISDFSIGGTTSTITVYEWNTACKKTGTMVGGQLCGDANLLILASSDNANCATASASDPYCGIVNPADGTTAPWPFLDKKGFTTFSQGELFEAGIDLTALGLDDRCYSSVMSETRSSTSTTAVLKDFALGSFGHCGADLSTTPKLVSGGSVSTYPVDGSTIGTGGSIVVRDSANLTVTGIQTWAGTVSFYLCGPAATSCDANGTLISTTAVDQTTLFPILSDPVTVTSAGTYYWAAVFSTSVPGLPDQTVDGSNERFIVTPVDPAITTDATDTVEIGSPISDQATLSGAAKQPNGSAAGGTITFRAYGPYVDAATATCAVGELTYTSTPAIAVSGNGTYSSGSFTPAAAGQYAWVASYSGNAPNTNAVSGTCGDSTEISIVTPRQPAISTLVTATSVPLGTAIGDTATLSGTSTRPDGSAAGGSIVFRAYGPYTDLSSPADLCKAGELQFTSAAVAVSGNGTYTSGTFTPTAIGTYLWIASYSGDSPNTLAVSGTCGDTGEATLIFSLQPAISTAQTYTVSDSATITVASGAGPLAGSVQFQLFDNLSCTGTPLFAPTAITVAGTLASPYSQTVDSGTYTFTGSQPALSWLVIFTSSNAGHKDVTSACGVETGSLTYANTAP